MSEKAFEVITGGLQTTVQDLGRPGYLSIGMPIAGAQDSFSLRIGNLLVGNEPGKKTSRRTEKPSLSAEELKSRDTHDPDWL